MNKLTTPQAFVLDILRGENAVHNFRLLRDWVEDECDLGQAMYGFAIDEAKAPGDCEVYGCSDDLIEIEGALREEFGGGDDPRFLTFDDGTVASIRYGDEGIWKIEVVKTGAAKHSLETCDDSEADRYSDTLRIGPVRSVIISDERIDQ